VNSNHVLVFDGSEVPARYAAVFEEVWNDDVKEDAWLASPLSSEIFKPTTVAAPVTITFAPHTATFAGTVLQGIADRIELEQPGGNVLFAVMQLDNGSSPVWTALQKLNQNEQVFSYGVSDSPGGIALTEPGKKTGVLVTGLPVDTQL